MLLQWNSLLLDLCFLQAFRSYDSPTFPMVGFGCYCVSFSGTDFYLTWRWGVLGGALMIPQHNLTNPPFQWVTDVNSMRFKYRRHNLFWTANSHIHTYIIASINASPSSGQPHSWTLSHTLTWSFDWHWHFMYHGSAIRFCPSIMPCRGARPGTCTSISWCSNHHVIPRGFFSSRRRWWQLLLRRVIHWWRDSS